VKRHVYDPTQNPRFFRVPNPENLSRVGLGRPVPNTASGYSQPEFRSSCMPSPALYRSSRDQRTGFRGYMSGIVATSSSTQLSLIGFNHVDGVPRNVVHFIEHALSEVASGLQRGLTLLARLPANISSMRSLPTHILKLSNRILDSPYQHFVSQYHLVEQAGMYRE